MDSATQSPPRLIADSTIGHVDPANTRPVANFSVTPAVGSPRTVFVLNASASHDAEDSLDELLFRWDFHADGRWDVDWSSNPITTVEAGPPGAIRIILEVRDTGLLTGTALRDVQIVGTSTTLLGWTAVLPKVVIMFLIIGIGGVVAAVVHDLRSTRSSINKEHGNDENKPE